MRLLYGEHNERNGIDDNSENKCDQQYLKNGDASAVTAAENHLYQKKRRYLEHYQHTYYIFRLGENPENICSYIVLLQKAVHFGKKSCNQAGGYERKYHREVQRDTVVAHLCGVAHLLQHHYIEPHNYHRRDGRKKYPETELIYMDQMFRIEAAYISEIFIQE